jgi:hypothetical protein
MHHGFFHPARLTAGSHQTRTISAICLQTALVLLAILMPSLSASAQTSILTQHYDTLRTGQNINETILTPANVNTTSFGKVFSISVQGYVYAQPLYVPGVAIPGNGTHNVLYVATEHDFLYAFDADNGAQLWLVNFLVNGATPLSPSDVGNTQDINPEIGITGTPTIDPTSKTLYVVVNTKESGKLIYRLHAIDITTGAEKLGGPVLITASVPGTAPDGNGSTVPLNPQWANQRPGLLLLNGYLYIGFSSHGDNGPWHGWVLGYNATSLAQTGAWCTSPNGKGNGIWGAGSGLAADAAGNAYVATGNGDYTVQTPAPPPSTTIDFGDSLVRLSLTNGVPVPTDYFTPYNQASLDSGDADVGSGGVLVLPDQPGPFNHILLQSGKQGSLYVVNRDKMTSDGSHYCNGCSSDPEIIQTVSLGGGLWSMPTYWNSQIYVWSSGGHLEAYSLTNGMVSQSPTSTSGEASNFPGSTAVVSSNGTSNGIVWAVESDAYNSSGPAILRAYSANDVADLLYGSNLTSGRDTLGSAVKFVVPVVTNGKVYVGTQNEVDVFGLISGVTQAVAPAFNPAGGSYNVGTQVAMSTSTPNASIYYTTDGNPATSASTLYTGAITVTETTTFNAIAVSQGYIQSTDASATYIIQDQAAPPDISPAAGTYSSAQTAQLSDTSPTPTIYYTTDGSKPNHNSPQYSKPISVTSTVTINAIASSPGLNDSPVVTAMFTIDPNATTINFGMGFATPTGLQFNGSTDLDDSRLQLTNGGSNEAGSAFFETPVDISNFTTDFTFQLSDAQGDGMTFTLQNSSAAATALGPNGGGLGYGPDTPSGTPGISNSVAVKYDLYSNDGEGDDSTGLYTNGASPTVPAKDMTSSGVILSSGDTMTVHITYDGTTLTMTITDYTVNATFTTSWPINIPQTIGGNIAYAGFTAGTGGFTASQKIETWTFASTPSATQAQAPVITPKGGKISTTQTISISDVTTGAAIFFTTDGSVPSPGQGTTQQYNVPFTLPASATVKAIATASGFATSALSAQSFTVQRVVMPVLAPTGRAILTTQTISITDGTTGAAIYYTTDGTTPSPGMGSTQQYLAPFTLASPATVKAIATESGYQASATGSATYTFQKASSPVVTPKSGTIATTQTITLTDSTSGAAIYYTTDGTVPSPGQGTTKKFGSPFTLSASGPLKAIAIAAGYLNSALTTTSFTLQRATNPTFSPTGGAISATQPITLSNTTTGAAIYYTTDGSAPSPGMGTTKKYGSPFTLSASATVKALAVAPGYVNSAIVQANYTVH